MSMIESEWLSCPVYSEMLRWLENNYLDYVPSDRKLIKLVCACCCAYLRRRNLQDVVFTGELFGLGLRECHTISWALLVLGRYADGVVSESDLYDVTEVRPVREGSCKGGQNLRPTRPRPQKPPAGQGS